jgi:hypothetical protein
MAQPEVVLADTRGVPALELGPRGSSGGGFTHIRVGGSPYDMGLQHGEQVRDEIRQLLQAIDHHVLHGQPGITGWAVRQAVHAIVRVMETQIPPRYRREIAGVARAADVSYGDLLMLSCFDDVLANLRSLAAMVGRLGCSAYALMGERTAGGDLLCGRNLDYFVASATGDDVWAATNFMKENVVVVEYTPADCPSFLSVGWPGFIGVATGLSASGLTASALVVQTTRNWPAATPSCFLYRRVMEEARTLDQAVEILRSARRTQGHNVLLGSGEEKTAAVVEYSPWGFAVRRPENGWIATTNHFNDVEMVRRYARFTYQGSTERLARLDELSGRAEPPPAKADDIGRFLLNSETRRPDLDAYCSVLNPCTIYSTYFEPALRRMWVRAADSAERVFQRLDLGG